ncbi:hypothetical protein [Pedobacter sp. Leaf250]|uniref:hypothetical protein n=1 Tax=Pedobacter sp. Leaf250 TaxID=2876559 RepID=UPI001E4909A6|nr:hypothetical protein [Pedobacter sp. Leaf250]
MKNLKYYLLAYSVVLVIACNENEGKKKIAKVTVKDTVEKQSSGDKKISVESVNSKKDFSKIKNQSLVISCGSGCAMTYNVKDINQINETSIKVIFKVDMYIDEKQTETFDETYNFIYNAEHKIEKIIQDGENENVLNNMLGGAKQTFKDFAAELIK